METNPNAELSEDGKTLVVPEQGTWVVNRDGTITYRAELGRPIVEPTPISYSVADKSGRRLETYTTIILNQSKVAGATDTAEACEDYEENVSLYDNWSIVFVILLGSIFGLLLVRREKI